MSAQLIHALDSFMCLRLTIRVQVQHSGPLPELKGSMYHGLLGQGLMKIDPRLYHALFEQHDHQQPKAYSIVCHDLRQQVESKQTLSFELRLFGDATKAAYRLIESIDYAISELGIGPKRIKAEIISLSSHVAGHEYAGIIPFSLMSKWQQSTFNGQECALELTSPMRLKMHDQLLRCAPNINVVVNSVARRLNSLCRYWYNDDPALTELIYSAVPKYVTAETLDHTYWQDWHRYGKRTGNISNFGGLKGMVSYQGAISEAQPWLLLGETLQIGGKTTFGLGHYILIRSE